MGDWVVFLLYNQGWCDGNAWSMVFFVVSLYCKSCVGNFVFFSGFFFKSKTNDRWKKYSGSLFKKRRKRALSRVQNVNTISSSKQRECARMGMKQTSFELNGTKVNNILVATPRRCLCVLQTLCSMIRIEFRHHLWQSELKVYNKTRSLHNPFLMRFNLVLFFLIFLKKK